MKRASAPAPLTTLDESKAAAFEEHGGTAVAAGQESAAASSQVQVSNTFIHFSESSGHAAAPSGSITAPGKFVGRLAGAQYVVVPGTPVAPTPCSADGVPLRTPGHYILATPASMPMTPTPMASSSRAGSMGGSPLVQQQPKAAPPQQTPRVAQGAPQLMSAADMPPPMLSPHLPPDLAFRQPVVAHPYVVAAAGGGGSPCVLASQPPPPPSYAAFGTGTRLIVPAVEPGPPPPSAPPTSPPGGASGAIPAGSLIPLSTAPPPVSAPAIMTSGGGPTAVSPVGMPTVIGALPTAGSPSGLPVTTHVVQLGAGPPPPPSAPPSGPPANVPGAPVLPPLRQGASPAGAQAVIQGASPVTAGASPAPNFGQQPLAQGSVVEVSPLSQATTSPPLYAPPSYALFMMSPPSSTKNAAPPPAHAPAVATPANSSPAVLRCFPSAGGAPCQPSLVQAGSEAAAAGESGGDKLPIWPETPF